MTNSDIKIILDDYIDMIYIYEIICNETYTYYYNLKFLFEFPIIFINIFMTIINSIVVDVSIIKYSNIFLNVTTMLLVSLSNYFKINEKCEILKINRDKFIKLYNIIEKKKYTDKTISVDFIDNIISNYDNIVESINFTFPNFILKKIRTAYAEKKTLPIFINGIRKLDKYRCDNGIILNNIKLEETVEADKINIIINDNVINNKNNNTSIDSDIIKNIIPSTINKKKLKKTDKAKLLNSPALTDEEDNNK